MVKYPGIVHNDSDGLWIEFPDLPISGTQGEDMDDLIRMAVDCISGYFEILLQEGEDIPEPSRPEGENIIYIEPYPEIAIPLMIKELRKQQNITQSEVAERIGVKYQTYQQVENLKKFNATIKTLNKIAKALGKRLRVDFV